MKRSAIAFARGARTGVLFVVVEGVDDLAVVEGMHQLAAQGLHGVAVVVGHGDGTASRGVDLQQDPDLVELDELGHGQALHDRALVGFSGG
jgi:hypothetical protein